MLQSKISNLVTLYLKQINMIEQIQQPWPWYVAGVLIGLIVPAL